MELERTHQAMPYGVDQIEIHNGAHVLESFIYFSEPTSEEEKSQSSADSSNSSHSDYSYFKMYA